MTTVQPSASSRTCRLPILTIGSIVNVWPGRSSRSGVRVTVVQDLRIFMKYPPDAVAAVFPHYTEILSASTKFWMAWPMSPSRLPGRAWAMPLPERLPARVYHPFTLHRALAHEEHPAAVTMKAVLDDGYVHVDDIAVLQDPVARDAMADHMVHRRADGFGEATVVQGGRYRMLHVDNEFMTDPVQFIGADARLHVRADHVQYVCGQPSRQPHGILFRRGFD